MFLNNAIEIKFYFPNLKFEYIYLYILTIIISNKVYFHYKL